LVPFSTSAADALQALADAIILHLQLIYGIHSRFIRTCRLLLFSQGLRLSIVASIAFGPYFDLPALLNGDRSRRSECDEQT
jgi:hypothetical protein